MWILLYDIMENLNQRTSMLQFYADILKSKWTDEPIGWCQIKILNGVETNHNIQYLALGHILHYSKYS